MVRTLLLTLLAAYQMRQSHTASPDSYTAAVVEFASPLYAKNVSADDVMLTNAAIFAEYMKNASASQADIIVFPEGGLHGQNVGKSIPLPSVSQKANPCKQPDKYHKVLVSLSCAASQYNMYAVVNLGEEYFNTTTNKTEYYNSNVALDRNGTVVARYRKYNPYGEPVSKPALDLSSSMFTTDFDVTFGMFICFDIVFMEPGVVLAREHGVKHFAFPHCWTSELPFLTAIQAQWGFAYGLDTVLLAAGCNNPDRGGSGSGIYHGRQGALQYFQTDLHTSRLIVAQVAKSFAPNKVLRDQGRSEGIVYQEPADVSPSHFSAYPEVHLLDDQPTNSSLFVLRDFMDQYYTQLVSPSSSSASLIPSSTSPLGNITSFDVTELREQTICQNSLCCDFQVKLTSSYNRDQPTPKTRGDDFTNLFYRLAVFDGVRSYGGGVATGGVQVCAVVSCVNDTLASCGLRSDNPSAQVAYGSLFKVGTLFHSISISGQFVYNHTFVFPDILATSSASSGFGALVSSDAFAFNVTETRNGAVNATLTFNSPISNLVTAAIYARQYDRDGQKIAPTNVAQPLHYNVFMIFFLFLFFFNCTFSWVN